MNHGSITLCRNRFIDLFAVVLARMDLGKENLSPSIRNHQIYYFLPLRALLKTRDISCPVASAKGRYISTSCRERLEKIHT
jgi:hypothetical protein